MLAIEAKSDGIIHIQSGRFIPVEEDPSRAMASCGHVGRVEEVDFATDPRKICGRCMWAHSSEHERVDPHRHRRRPVG